MAMGMNSLLQRQQANEEALKLASQVDPCWVDVRTAAAALALPDKTLLHAGPAFADPSRPSAPVMSSAVLCCLYEGWASTETEAENLIQTGQVRLLPSHSFSVVTPLAAVISPSTSLVEVSDAATGSSCWSLLPSGAGPQLRFGSRDPAILPRLAFRDKVLAPLFQQQLQQQAIRLIPLAIAGIGGGDDLHYQTDTANHALVDLLVEVGADTTLIDTVQQAPLFFLPLWMASCRLMLSAMSAGAKSGDSSVVVALAGNGESLGLCLSRDPEQWISVAASVPQGKPIKAMPAAIAGALGDSGVIDAAGFGAQLWHRRPSITAVMHSWYQGDADSVSQCMVGPLDSLQPELILAGMDVCRCAAAKQLPAIAIAMLEATGTQGLVGKGLAAMPRALIEKSCRSLNSLKPSLE